MQTAQVANKRLNEIFDILPEQTDSIIEKNFSNQIFEQDVTIDNLSFSYNMKSPVLKNISCIFPANSKIALVGLSGSGKSTLAKLLVHFYEPSEGDIYYGKINYLDISHKKLRNYVTYIPQESFFFSGTILENLIFGLEEIPKFEQIWDICEAVQLTDFINQLPLRFDIFSKSKGIVYPERVTSSYSQISRPKELGGYGLRPENLTSRTAIKITDEDGKIVNIIIKETYNAHVNNTKSLLYQIRYCEERIETLKQRGGKWAKKAQYWEERRYYLTHKQEIDQLTRRYVRKQA